MRFNSTLLSALIRLAFGGLLIFLFQVTSSGEVLTGLGVAHLGVSLVILLVFLWKPELKSSPVFGYLRSVLDISALTLIVAISGGPFSFFISGYILIVVLSSIEVSPTRGIISALISVLAFGSLLVLNHLEALSLLNIFISSGEKALSPDVFVTVLSLILLSLACLGTFYIIHSLFASQYQARGRAEEALERAKENERDAREVRMEVEKLNEFSRQINETVSLTETLEAIGAYMHDNFQIEKVMLMLVDKKNQELYTYHIFSLFDYPSEQLQFLTELRVPLNKEGGTLARTYHKKKIFYASRITGYLSDLDRQIVENINLGSLVQIPLIHHDEAIGIITTGFTTARVLNRRNRESLIRFCNQITGAILTSQLYREAEVARTREELEKNKTRKLLINVLPEKIAAELLERGRVEPLLYDSITIMFTDFIGFTQAAMRMLPHELVDELDRLFDQFDNISERNNLEKLKTIGDAYMCAGGLPEINYTHPVDVCLAAMEIQTFMREIREIKKQITGEEFWELRLGIHTGVAMAGVIGKSKFSYDVWGDAVNIASRMESAGTTGRINISDETYHLVKYFFNCEFRGDFEVRNHGKVSMYYLNSIRQDLSAGGEGRLPNEKFTDLYEKLGRGARFRFRHEAAGSHRSTG